MTVYFLDEFNGSGPLNGHVPDINLASGAAWVAGNNNSGTAWNSGAVNAVLSGGSLVVTGTSYAPGNILNPGAAPAPIYNYPLPPQVYTNAPYKFSWSWTPGQSSSLALTGYGILLRVGTAQFQFGNTAGATKNLVFGNSSVPVSFTAGVTYNGSLEVRVDEQTLQFMGQTLVYSGTGDLLTDLAFGDIYFNLDPGHAMGFIKVESLTPNLFWTSKVGCTES